MPTLTVDDERLTSPGAVLGTVAYMSPEQARGKDLDARSDLFSFGVVLYEMVTGRVPFPGDTSAVIFDAILNRAPVPPVRLNPEVPRELEEIIRKALEKERDLRYQHAGEIRTDLKRLKRETGSRRGAPAETPAAVREPLRRRIWFVAMTSMAVIAVSTLAFMLTRPVPAPRVSGYSKITHDGRSKISMFTDGTRLYFNEFTSSLVISQVSSTGGEVSTIPMPSPQMVLLGVSADGANLLVADKPALLSRGPLWGLPVLGGSPRRLGDTVGQDAAWSQDGQMLVYANGRELLSAKADGTQSRKLHTMPFDFNSPVWSPDGKVIRFNMRGGLWEISTAGTNLHQLFPGWHEPANECCGKWTPDGRYYVFQSGNNIWAMAEANNLLRRASNQPVQLTSGPMQLPHPLPGRDGKKLYVVGTLQRGELTRYNTKTGQFVPFLLGISAYGMSFSKDGKWVAYVAYPEGTLWRSRADGSDQLQLSWPAMARIVFGRWCDSVSSVMAWCRRS